MRALITALGLLVFPAVLLADTPPAANGAGFIPLRREAVPQPAQSRFIPLHKPKKSFPLRFRAAPSAPAAPPAPAVVTAPQGEPEARPVELKPRAGAASGMTADEASQLLSIFPVTH